MIKLVVTGVWVCALSLASVYFSMQHASDAEAKKATPAFFGGLDYVRGDLVSVPVISQGAVRGYFLVRLVYTVDPHEMAKLTVPAQDLIVDALYTELVGNQVIDFPKMDNFDLAAFRTDIRSALNKRVGTNLFHDVMVDQIDYLTKEDIRANKLNGNYSASDVKTPPGAAPAKAVAGG